MTNFTIFRTTLTEWFGSPTAFNAGQNFVRASICLIVIATQLWLQWRIGINGNVPPAVIGIAGVATGYYLTGESSPTMKGLVSLIYVAAFSAFYLMWQWAPEAVLSQVTTVVGIYFGRKNAGSDEPKIPAAEVQALKPTASPAAVETMKKENGAT